MTHNQAGKALRCRQENIIYCVLAPTLVLSQSEETDRTEESNVREVLQCYDKKDNSNGSSQKIQITHDSYIDVRAKLLHSMLTFHHSTNSLSFAKTTQAAAESPAGIRVAEMTFLVSADVHSYRTILNRTVPLKNTDYNEICRALLPTSTKV